MFRKRLIGVVFAAAMAFSAAAADIVVRIAPPVAVVETRGAPLPAATTYGSRVIIVGTVTPMYGLPADGRCRHVRTNAG